MGSKKSKSKGPKPWNPGEWKDGQYKNFSGTIFQNPGHIVGKAANAMGNAMQKKKADRSNENMYRGGGGH